MNSPTPVLLGKVVGTVGTGGTPVTGGRLVGAVAIKYNNDDICGVFDRDKQQAAVLITMKLKYTKPHLRIPAGCS